MQVCQRRSWQPLICTPYSVQINYLINSRSHHQKKNLAIPVGGWPLDRTSSAHLGTRCNSNSPPPPIPHHKSSQRPPVCLCLRFSSISSTQPTHSSLFYSQRPTAYLHRSSSVCDRRTPSLLHPRYPQLSASTAPGMADAPARQHLLDTPWLNRHRSCGLDAIDSLAY